MERTVRSEDLHPAAMFGDTIEPTVRYKLRASKLDDLHPEDLILVLLKNRHCEFVYWLSEQALSCSVCSHFLVLPQECGGHENHV